ncbi:MAG: DUF4358 domain-containing protein [Lachnospiraceae bacterium]|nr:DUF4358 domain-containing protein [Lachnospiraceae bacterium]
MKNVIGNETKTGKRGRRIAAVLLAFFLFAGLLPDSLSVEAAAKITCKKLCQTALKETGGSSKLEYQTTKKTDFPGFTISESEKISSLAYLCDEKEVYAICVVKAKSKSDAADLLESLQTYQESLSESDYLNDYSSTEQKILKNSVCGKKGKYVWYIAMSTKESVNKKGQTKIKKKL